LRIKRLRDIQLKITAEGHTRDDPISGIIEYGVYKDQRDIKPCVLIPNNNAIKRSFQSFWEKFAIETSTCRNQPPFKGYNFNDYGFGECDLEPDMISPMDERIDSYEEALRRAINKIKNEDLNMLLVVLPQNFVDEDYYWLKAIAFNEKQVSQFFRLTTFDRKFPLVFWNLAVSLYAKMEGIPWALALEPPLEKDPIDVDLFIGICFVQRDQKSFVGVATILDRLSEHIVTINSKPISYAGQQLHMTREDIFNLITECLKRVKFGVDSVVVQYATPFNKFELQGVKDALKGVSTKAFVHIETETLSRLYSLDTPTKDVNRGTALIINDNKAVLCTTGKCGILGTSTEIEDEDEEWSTGLTTSLKYRGIGTPKPVGLNKVGDLDIETICRQVLALTKLRWNTSEVNIRIPATIEYARKIGYLCKYGIPRTVRSIKYVL
jgi:hypothetical protein